MSEQSYKKSVREARHELESDKLLSTCVMRVLNKKSKVTLSDLIDSVKGCDQEHNMKEIKPLIHKMAMQGILFRYINDTFSLAPIGKDVFTFATSNGWHKTS